MVTLTPFLPLGGGAFLGWTIGANNASNVFGTAVGARIISFRNAALICAISVFLGAALQGTEGIKTLSGITEQSISTAVLVSIAAALTGTLMTYFGLPISTSQAVVGAIFGISLATDNIQYNGLLKVVACWIGTPIGSMIIACVAYKLIAVFLIRIPISILTRDKFLWAGLLICGAYGSYALGANNVANCTGMFSGLIPGINDRLLATLGGISISIGVLTYSRRVIMNIGKGIMRLDAFTALVSVASVSLTTHAFAIIGAPVSTSQGIVGAILGIGLLRGARHHIHFNVLRDIVLGWVLTPAISLIFAAAGYAIFF